MLYFYSLFAAPYAGWYEGVQGSGHGKSSVACRKLVGEESRTV